MRIVLSNHARLRCQIRNISFEQIVDCIQNPDYTSDEYDEKICYKKLDNKDMMLLMCYTVAADQTIKVVTVIKTSKLKKYYK